MSVYQRTPGDRVLIDLMDALELCEAKPTNYSDESIKAWVASVASAKEYLDKTQPKPFTLQQVIDGATD